MRLNALQEEWMNLHGNVLVDTNIYQLMDAPKPAIRARREDVQASSLDLRVGITFKQVASVPSLVKGFSYNSFVKDYTLNSYSGMVFPDSDFTLTPGNIYITELDVDLNLPKGVSGYINPKSSVGRVDLACHVLAEGATQFDVIPEQYQGKLFLLMMPQTISVRDVCDVDVVQLRLFDGPRTFMSGYELHLLHRSYPIVEGTADPKIVNDGLILHLDLENYNPPCLFGLRTGRPMSMKQRGQDPEHFFRTKKPDSQGNYHLEPNEFMLAATTETLVVPPSACVEMQPYNANHGEFRSNYAGFADPNFRGPIVCEIRNVSGVQMMVSHGMEIALFKFEGLRQMPSVLYGDTRQGGKPSNYQSQTGVRLSKYLRPWPVQLAAPEAAIVR